MKELFPLISVDILYNVSAWCFISWYDLHLSQIRSYQYWIAFLIFVQGENYISHTPWRRRGCGMLLAIQLKIDMITGTQNSGNDADISEIYVRDPHFCSWIEHSSNECSQTSFQWLIFFSSSEIIEKNRNQLKIQFYRRSSSSIFPFQEP